MNPSTEALAWALVHFVWQGAALALIAFAAIRWLRLQAEGRYLAGILTLAAMLAAPVVTYAVLARADRSTPAGSGLAASAVDLRTVPAGPGAGAEPATAPRFTSQATTLLLAAWLCGVAVFSLRLAGGWLVARRMVTRRVRPVTPEIALLARRVAARLALDRAVRIIESSAVSVPVMVGWLKPVVLLPAVAVSGLTPTQVEALIAHELAHVRRHDYLVNLLQAAVETLLFYHPAVWWVSRQVRAEREHCCDDLAVGICDRLVYVSALSDLAAMTVPRTVLAATGGSLLTRVKRILGSGDSAASPGGAWIPFLVGLVVLGAVAPALSSGADQTEAAAAAARATNVAVIEEAGARPQAPASPSAAAPEAQAALVSPVPSGWAQAFTAVLLDAAAQSPAARELQALLEELRKQDLVELLQRQSGEEKLKTDRQRVEIEHALLQLDMRQNLEASKIELEALRNQRDRLRQLHERGLVNRDELDKLELRMQEVESRMRHGREQMDLRMKEMALAQREITRVHEANEMVERAQRELLAQAGREPRDRQLSQNRTATAEAERQLREYMQAIEAYKAMLEKERGQEREYRARADRGRAEFGETTRESRLLENTVPVTNAAERIQAGDVLAVEISGESSLPTAYAVQTDGTVRLPILGSIKVAGLTVQQAGDAIRKQVSRVNSSATVHVSLRRPRTEERRQR